MYLNSFLAATSLVLVALPQQIDPGRLPSKVAAELQLIWPRVAVPKLIGPTETQVSS